MLQQLQHVACGGKIDTFCRASPRDGGVGREMLMRTRVGQATEKMKQIRRRREGGERENP